MIVDSGGRIRRPISGEFMHVYGGSVTTARRRRRVDARVYGGLLVVLALVPLLFLLIPMGALAWRLINDFDGISDQTQRTLREALRLSAITTGCTLALVLSLGTPLAYLLARKRFFGSRLVDTLIDLPIVLPPSVAGIALLLAFGRRGIIGQYLDQAGITIGFTTTAVVLAQCFVAMPFYVRAAKAGFGSVQREVEEAAAVDGAVPPQVFRDMTLPLALPSLAAGAVLAWARALGEFGATIMFAGNFEGTTQTMPLAIYGRYNAGDLSSAILLSGILLVTSAAILLMARLASGRNDNRE
jgi:molybdate transport system permease protein